MENSCNTRKIENVTRFQISLKWSHFLVTLFVTLLGTKNCYNTKSEHFSNKNVTFCYIFALTPLIPLLKNSDYFCITRFKKVTNTENQKVTNIFFSQNVTNLLYQNLVLWIIALLRLHTFYPNNLSHQYR